MWQLARSDTYERRFKRFSKDYPRELAAAVEHTETYFESLHRGANPLNLKFGWLHNEGRGLYAADQKGGGKGLAQIRLYFYPEVESETLWLLTIGDKSSQRQDIQDCRDMVEGLTQAGE